MKVHRRAFMVGGMAAMAGCSFAARTDLVAEAKREGRVVIYSSTDAERLSDLLKAFAQKYPEIKVDYRSLSAQDVYDRFRREVDAGAGGADLVISSAMDQQVKLVNDGYAQTYETPHRAALPDWAIWKDEAFAVTSEPIVIAYNRRLVPPADVPRSHDDFARLIDRDARRYRGAIGSYDPMLSPTGYLYLTQDVRIDHDSWELLSKIGATQPRLYQSASEMIEDTRSGKLAFTYNLIGSYALDARDRDPDFGVVVPEDYVLVTSRIALISRLAKNVNAARVFLDFLLSREGQALLARRHMLPLRSDVKQGSDIVAGTNVRAIRVDPGLMANLDHVTKQKFLQRWADRISQRGIT